MFAWGDNDHGQQGNGTTMVNRKPSLVHGLEDVKVNRVACGSSHSIAWLSPDSQASLKLEPVVFELPKDPLGAHLLGLYTAEKEAEEIASKKQSIRPSLTNIVMSLESSAAKQHALTHLLNAAHILQLRSCIVKALSNHSENAVNNSSMSLAGKVTNFMINFKFAVN